MDAEPPQSSSLRRRPWPLLLALLAAAAAYLLRARPQRLPPHLLGHPLRRFPALLDAGARASLMRLAQEIARFPTVTAAEAAYNITHEDIGEGREESPPDARGLCAHPFLIPSTDGRRCILPGRVDVGRHYVATGGLEGAKEQHADLLSRVQSFSRYLFEPLRHEATRSLFADASFLAAARSVCPADKQTLDPFQANLIIQVPGQTVAAHIDGVWFHGASRFHVPQWLLAVMQFSGLFEDRFIDQVQLVAYFHEWPGSFEEGGDFVFWHDGAALGAGGPERVRAAAGAGTAVDGSKTVHAAAVFRPGAAPPRLDKSRDNSLQFVAGNGAAGGAGAEWELVTDGRARRRYRAEELRFSVVYRARCFGDDAARERFAAELAAREGLLDLEDDILAPLRAELVRRGRATPARLAAMSRLELAMTLMDAFIKYPKPAAAAALVPANYCALPKLFPRSTWLQGAADLFCPLRSLAD